MIWFALLPALLVQDPLPSVHSSQLTYQRPAVRPFEPPSDFGRETAQGDDTTGVWRLPLIAPVTIDAYRHSYEVSPTDAVIAYEQAVTQAEIDYDARMGPLDGRWRVLGPDGAAVMSLVLFDEGADRPVEGAWARDARPGAASELGPIEDVRRDVVGPVDVALGAAGNLTLSPAADGHWVGLLIDDQEARAVVVQRSS